MARKLTYIFFISIGVSILVGLFIPHEHVHFWWEKIPAFDAIFGFLGCIVIVLGAKALGHHGIQKDEDYYD
ncbi:MAG: hypothetical protein DRG35_02365 [Deltaproteobacteria bacterium]|nr:hypothetical protein [Deltaproteobacteria bacterium]OQY16656.1 MAG: hypothetical protein B6I32_02785 [Desulfobacterium sp. 4572_20]HDH87777.1 hypothetical protein [Desulfobacteraceae bacterium]MBW2104494.1 hypothetical protein [Deltaproteobacteria bacterium]MBW2332430.1 hypothetical protein [Deltaproteobacteria bacterium]